MFEQMTAMVKENDICVLATAGANRPHCSLMAYVADATGQRIYMATPADSRKFANLGKNPVVSLLIDTRTKQPREQIRALTVSGTCAPVDDPAERAAAAERLRTAHPQLQRLLEDPGVEILSVKVSSFLLLDGVSDAHFLEVSS
ncbi:MAG: pyridoxamine 5'-phosphate oxidase family protein [Desulfobacterales bacterium]|nr:pyridoxamine 5'-phosphate oxidase family protein [Desulfobacterales bacterium]